MRTQKNRLNETVLLNITSLIFISRKKDKKNTYNYKSFSLRSYFEQPNYMFKGVDKKINIVLRSENVYITSRTQYNVY